MISSPIEEAIMISTKVKAASGRAGKCGLLQSKIPLTPTLSPSHGEREKRLTAPTPPPGSELSGSVRQDPLSPSDGERARVRGRFKCNKPAKAGTPYILAGVW